MEEIDSSYVDDDNDDAASDASSDLFEIESLKGKSSNNFLTRQTSDAASSCVSPNNYAPSEASIEWSVVTASAAVMSDCEDQMSEFTIRSPI
ncbi:protein PHYTOCHROME KINASE SUBSTRATE 1, partial [Trifolium medium]|nr:protein PHYTOCHROME KINASE SUBSTRATE 1 [Trifolium medium]